MNIYINVCIYLKLDLYIYKYVCYCVHIYIRVNIHEESERERARERYIRATRSRVDSRYAGSFRGIRQSSACISGVTTVSLYFQK